MTGRLPPRAVVNLQPNIILYFSERNFIRLRLHRTEVMFMTDYEIIMVFLRILAILLSFGSLLINLISFLDKRNDTKKK